MEIPLQNSLTPLLKEIKQKTHSPIAFQQSSSTRSLYDHITTVITHIGHLKNPLRHLMAYSNLFKQTDFQMKLPPTQSQLRNSLRTPFIIEIPKTHPPKHRNSFPYQSFKMQSEKVFRLAGLSLAPEQIIQIEKGLLELSGNTKGLRFWGVLNGITRRYFILQGNKQILTEKQPPKLQLNPSDTIEAIGTGSNTYVYFISTDLQRWEELPAVTPNQLLASKHYQSVLRGEGDDSHKLVSIITRITHSCQLVPKGMFVQQEEEVVPSQDFKIQEISQLKQLQNWVHLNPWIAGNGRCVGVTEDESKPQRLRSIVEDKPEGRWSGKIKGSSQQYSKQEGSNVSYETVVIRNKDWPGWNTVVSNGTVGSFYCGYGLKSSQPLFHPSEPSLPQLQQPFCEEVSEPNPRQPLDQLEHDSDDDKKVDDS